MVKEIVHGSHEILAPQMIVELEPILVQPKILEFSERLENKVQRLLVVWFGTSLHKPVILVCNSANACHTDCTGRRRTGTTSRWFGVVSQVGHDLRGRACRGRIDGSTDALERCIEFLERELDARIQCSTLSAMSWTLLIFVATVMNMKTRKCCDTAKQSPLEQSMTCPSVHPVLGLSGFVFPRLCLLKPPEQTPLLRPSPLYEKP